MNSLRIFFLDFPKMLVFSFLLPLLTSHLWAAVLLPHGPLSQFLASQRFFMLTCFPFPYVFKRLSFYILICKSLGD